MHAWRCPTCTNPLLGLPAEPFSVSQTAAFHVIPFCTLLIIDARYLFGGPSQSGTGPTAVDTGSCPVHR